MSARAVVFASFIAVFSLFSFAVATGQVTVASDGSGLDSTNTIITTGSGDDTNDQSCTDECPYSGHAYCSGNYSVKCGNYDTDSCLEWGEPLYCAHGCAGGICGDAQAVQENMTNYTCGMPKEEALAELSRFHALYVSKAEALQSYMETFRSENAGNPAAQQALHEMETMLVRYHDRVESIRREMERIEVMDCSTTITPNATTPPVENESQELPQDGNVTNDANEVNETHSFTEPQENTHGLNDIYEEDMKQYESLNLSEQDRVGIRNNEWLDFNDTVKFRQLLNHTYREADVAKTQGRPEVVASVAGIRENDIVKVSIAEEEIPVRQIEVAMRNAVDEAEIRVERLPSAPAATAQAPRARQVYEYMEIAKSVRDDDVQDVTIGFAVRKAWLSEKNLTSGERVVLYRLHGENWTELPTRRLSEDGVNLYFESFSPGLSFFVIGITAAATSPIQVELPSETSGPEDDIARIKFDWTFVAVVLALVAILAVIRFTPLSGKISGALNREKPADLQKRMSELKADREEALNRYYKREITELQMTSIVNEKKKQEFDIEMKLRRMLEKKGKSPAPLG